MLGGTKLGLTHSEVVLVATSGSCAAFDNALLVPPSVASRILCLANWTPELEDKLFGDFFDANAATVVPVTTRAITSDHKTRGV